MAMGREHGLIGAIEGGELGVLKSP
jgi:hypothetical protein